MKLMERQDSTSLEIHFYFPLTKCISLLRIFNLKVNEIALRSNAKENQTGTPCKIRFRFSPEQFIAPLGKL